ncbi:hypothetical protein [Sphingomonas sp. dw_22]|uniref:hypothetical protein n=1 Tax=Sphingomonas sp. dw_22 TaxID=2721175 RepID=UPI001BD415F2|nr:hypothetical protein [Sphingomonas sp. dw_22]
MRELAFIFAAAGLLAACTPKPVATVASLPPGIPAGAQTFAIVAAPDAGSQAAAPLVEARLRRLGYTPSATPDLRVEVSTAARARTVGAFTPGKCGASNPDWIDPPAEKRLFEGGKLLTLNIRTLDARTGMPLHQASATLRSDAGLAEAQAALTNAALGVDPREAPKAAAPRGC